LEALVRFLLLSIKKKMTGGLFPVTNILTRGCVSGEQISNIRNKIGQDKDGEYRWDAIDGWEELEYVLRQRFLVSFSIAVANHVYLGRPQSFRKKSAA
jgi:hypothetical protein